jgi:hypothetical protein
LRTVPGALSCSRGMQKKTRVDVCPASHAVCFACVLCLCALPGAILLADVRFLSWIWRARSEFGRSLGWSLFLLWMAWRPSPGRIC